MVCLLYENGERYRGGIQIGLSSVRVGSRTEMYPENTEGVAPTQDDEGQDVHGAV